MRTVSCQQNHGRAEQAEARLTGYLDRQQLVVLLTDEDDDHSVAITDPKTLARLYKFMAVAGVPADAAEIRITLGVATAIRVVWTPAGVVDQ
jgi:hypothetical protein